MQINWAQLITNVLGFLLLFWGMKKFAWGPLLAYLDERRNKIEGDFGKIRAGEADNLALKDKLDAELREVDATARKKIEEATAEGNRLAAALKDEAREDARGLLDKARVDIDHERAKARVALRDDIVSMAVMGAEKILRHEVRGEGQTELVQRYIDDLEGNTNA